MSVQGAIDKANKAAAARVGNVQPKQQSAAEMDIHEVLAALERLLKDAPRGDRRLYRTTEFKMILAGVAVVVGADFLGTDPGSLWEAAILVASLVFGRQVEKGLKGR